MTHINYNCLNFSQLSVDDLYQILRLRSEVFVVEQQCAYQDLDEMDQQAWHLMGTSADYGLVAYARILQPEQCGQTECSIGRVVVKYALRKEKLGQQLMQHAIQFAKDQYPQHPIKISAQTYLTAFYQGLGFVNTGDFYLEDDIPHQSMVYQPK